MRGFRGLGVFESIFSTSVSFAFGVIVPVGVAAVAYIDGPTANITKTRPGRVKRARLLIYVSAVGITFNDKLGK